jgi:mannose/fructose/N-acetylgalactosamine-specific phosphotransferase system component IIC
MNLNSAATLVAVSALIGYFLLRFLFPALQFERLVYMGSLAIISIFLMFLYRRQKPKKEMAEQAKAKTKTSNSA